MSKRVTKKVFYKSYIDGWPEIARQMVLDSGKCSFCEHNGSGKNILTVAHLDQNPQNNEPENVKVLCRSCHIKNDQKYHLFSMGTSKKTDNSYTDIKVSLRLETVQMIHKQEINVLEAYSGNGVLWKEVLKNTDKQVNIIPIEVKDGKKGFYLKGSNEKFMPLFDFSHFDIIDLDAYGVPFNQLEVVFEKKFKGIVHCTYIQSGMGRLPNGLLQKIGYPKNMINKIPTLFCKNGMEKMERYLQINGVDKITGHFIGRKNYFYFNLDN